ncbi:MAG TPA: porin family protein [Candidatus Bacteroides merdigallinarum]|uniref:Porin family protein n=1 Tax=Candidatus Bacteroides merdigallinarum TaxID=2838473 RepID=A0A9D2J1L6_9BACE|nr:porin family protein [Candidatus Bacteroides merdigallinarum]
MKKVFTVLTIAVCSLLMATTTARAQLIKWGVKGGVNVTKIDFDEGYKDKMAGFFIGPMAELTIPVVGLGVDAALLFSQKGIKADTDATKQVGLDIPVNLKYTFGLGSAFGIFLAAGPDFYFDFKGEKDGVEKKKAQVGINVGGGLKLLRHLQLGVNYNIPIGDHFEVDDLKGKDKTWQISLAYIF